MGGEFQSLILQDYSKTFALCDPEVFWKSRDRGKLFELNLQSIVLGYVDSSVVYLIFKPATTG